MERGWKPSMEISPNCPRCGSANTKFCYYNNYSLTQPRYFCKGCRRYWTKGGSLRNVPVGGGCRKNRRGKSLRLPTDFVSSKNLSCGVVHTEPIGNSYCNKAKASAESNNTSDGSHIDLALVYANFLNPHPDNKAGIEVANEYDPSLQFSSVSTESKIQLLPEQNGLIGCLTHSELSADNHLSNNDQIYCSGLLESVHKHQQCTSHETSNYELPQFPGDVLSSDQEMMWSNPHSSMSQALQPSKEPALGGEVQDPNLLFGNWSPFDLSSDDTFPRI